AYGKHRYRVTHEQRSLEGSAVFLFTTFLLVHLPLLLFTGLERVTCVLVATQIALLVASFEAIGTNGSDNLFVPLGAYYLLMKLTARPPEAIAVQLAVQLAILLLTLLVARRTRFFSFSGAIAAHLMLYAAFSLGGPPWIVAPALALSVVAPLGLWAPRSGDVGIEYASSALLCAASLLLFLALRSRFPRPPGTGWSLRYLALAVLAATLATLPIHFHWIGAADWMLR